MRQVQEAVGPGTPVWFGGSGQLWSGTLLQADLDFDKNVLQERYEDLIVFREIMAGKSIMWNINGEELHYFELDSGTHDELIADKFGHYNSDGAVKICGKLEDLVRAYILP
jgi:hypothetical protein